MKQNDILIQHLEIKDPTLKIKYAYGLGDFITAILHSKMLGWLTRLIVGNQEYCKPCAMRATALNILFPIPFWRLFFKTEDQMIDAMRKDLIDAGFQPNTCQSCGEEGTNDESVSFSKMVSEQYIESDSNKNIKYKENKYQDESLNGYNQVGSSSSMIGDFIIKTTIYKQK